MNFSDIFRNHRFLTFELRDRLQHEQRVRRLVDQDHSQQIEVLEAENAELRLLLSAVLSVLEDKQVLSAEDVQQKLQSLLPPEGPAATGEDNPFSEMNTLGQLP